MNDHQDLSHSLWAATATEPRPDTPALAGTARADVAIIGGGYTGLSAALHLAENGTKVTVLEAKEPGWGASGRNGGQVIPGLKYDPDEIEALYGKETGSRMVALSGGAADVLFSLVERHAIRCDANRSGWIQPAYAERGLSIVRSRAEQWARRGAKVELLDRAQVADLVGAETYRGGWLDKRGGHVQPLSLARGLARAAQNAGAAIHGDSPVTRLERRRTAWRLATQAGAIEADTVLLCTNGYTTDLWPGLSRSIVPVRPFQAASAPLGENLRRSIFARGHVASDTKRLLSYYRLDRDGRLLMGGRGAIDHGRHPELHAQLRSDVHRLFPQAGEPQWAFQWSGWIAMTADHLPHLHALAPGLYAGLGYQGRGVAMALVMGRELAQRALHGDAPRDGWPLTPLRPLPFHGMRGPVLRGIRAYWRMRDSLER